MPPLPGSIRSHSRFDSVGKPAALPTRRDVADRREAGVINPRGRDGKWWEDKKGNAPREIESLAAAISRRSPSD